ncbi:MAG: metal-dependent transcriptional regulator [Sulfolobales archaeon]|nr:metal-dependent transcriptional regulator [Sulfolobales archaeon]MDW8082769.1 metal-dependent transcriptional regulator [Sulfolobales archaeon]
MGRYVRSVAVDDYLVTIYRLEEVFGVARTGDISRELGVRPATVSKVLRRLASEGYVVWSRFRGFKLSERGREVVKSLIRRHRICETFLAELGFDMLELHEYAHYMEHLPQQIVESIYRYVGSPKTCPHGNPIPGEKSTSRGRPLSGFKVGDTVRVVGYRGELVIYMKKALAVGLSIGVETSILSKQRRTIEVKIGSRIERLDLKTAMTVLAQYSN